MDGIPPPAAPSPFVLFSMQRLKLIEMHKCKTENHHLCLIYERVHFRFENQFTDFFFKYKKKFVLISIFHLFGTVVHKYMALSLITGLEVSDA